MNDPLNPLTPADCDLRDFPRMMVDLPRLFASEFNSTEDDTAWRFGVTLWFKSWHQVPAGSLPDDDAQLAKLVEIGRDLKTWRKSKDAALRGWKRANDGRLYHRTVAEFVLEAWIEKLLARLSSGAGNAKRYGHEFDPGPLNLDVERAAGMLKALNPRSRAADKLKRRQSRPDSGTKGVTLPPGENRPPTGSLKTLPPGDESPPTGTPDALPPGSQGTGTGTGKQEREEKSAREPRATRQGDFEPDPASATAKGYSAAEAEAMVAQFRDYHEAKGSTFKSWPAAWRTWVGNQLEFKPPRATPRRAPGGPPPDLGFV